MKTKSKRLALRAAASIAALTTLTSAVSCTKPGNPKGNKKIAVIGQSHVSFWDDFEKGAMDAGKELGYEIVYEEGENDSDFEKQKTFLEGIKIADYAAVVIAPNSETELDENLRTLKERGLTIIEVNNTTGEGTYDSHIGSSNTEAGGVAARKTAETLFKKYGDSKGSISGRGMFAIIKDSNATATVDRENGFKNEIIKRIYKDLQQKPDDVNELSISSSNNNNADMTEPEKYNNIIRDYFIETNNCDSEISAYDETKSIIAKYPNEIGVIFGTNTNTTLGICRAVEETNNLGKIIVVGVNADSRELEYIEKGVLEGTILQNPYIMGYLGVRYAYSTASSNDGNGSDKKDEASGKRRPPAYVDTGVTYIDSTSLHSNEYVKLITSLTNDEE